MRKNKNSAYTMGVMATVNSFIDQDSASRLGMVSNHLEQAASPRESDIPRTKPGFEAQMQSFDVHIDTNVIVNSVHHKYRKGFGQFAIKENPVVTVIFQCQETGIYDTVDIGHYTTNHVTYGVKFIHHPFVKRLHAGMRIPAGTVLARSTNVKDGNIWSNGLSCNVANMSLPSTIEDGYLVSNSFCQRGALLEMLKTMGRWGRKTYPLNSYGTAEVFKPFPGIGEYVREDGLLFAFREYDPLFDASNMTAEALMQIDHVHDHLIYTTPGAYVTDVTVTSGIGESKGKQITPEPMCGLAGLYIDQYHEYYRDIIKAYKEITRKDRNANLSPRLIQLVRHAFADSPAELGKKGGVGRVKRTEKAVPIDEFNVEITTVKYKPLGRGAKITGLHGDKGVITEIRPDEDMPTDKDGNRCDLVKLERAVVARMNVGQFTEQFVGAASRDATKEVVRQVNTDRPTDTIWDYLTGYYAAAGALEFSAVNAVCKSPEDIKNHIQSIVDSGVYLTIPPYNDLKGLELVKSIRNYIEPTYGPVEYRDAEGKMVWTKDNVLIGVQHMIVLEKSDLHPMAVSSGILQHHGLLAGSTKMGRYGHASKVQAFKVFSETEVRMYAAHMGGEIMAKVLTFANSPEAHRCQVDAILTSDTPGWLRTIQGIKTAMSRPLRFINHVLSGLGIKISTYYKGGNNGTHKRR